MAESPVKFFAVAADHPIFAGHFPGRPIVPGVMLLEWVVAEVIWRWGGAPAALRVREAKFFHRSSLASARNCTSIPRTATRCTFDIHREATAIARGMLDWNA